MIAREQKIIDDMTLQCEQEKEALLDKFTKTIQESHDIKVKDLEAQIAILNNKKCETVTLPPSNSDDGFPDEGVKILIEMEKDGNYTIK